MSVGPIAEPPRLPCAGPATATRGRPAPCSSSRAAAACPRGGPRLAAQPFAAARDSCGWQAQLTCSRRSPPPIPANDLRHPPACRWLVLRSAVEEVVELARAASVVALGPGLGARPRSSRSFAVCWTNWTMCRWCSMPMGSSRCRPLRKSIPSEPAPLILTPHPGEFAARRAKRWAQRMRSGRPCAIPTSPSAIALCWSSRGAGTIVADESASSATRPAIPAWRPAAPGCVDGRDRGAGRPGLVRVRRGRRRACSSTAGAGDLAAMQLGQTRLDRDRPARLPARGVSRARSQVVKSTRNFRAQALLPIVHEAGRGAGRLRRSRDHLPIVQQSLRGPGEIHANGDRRASAHAAEPETDASAPSGAQAHVIRCDRE